MTRVGLDATSAFDGARAGRRPVVALAGGMMGFFLLVGAFADPLKHLAKGWIFGPR